MARSARHCGPDPAAAAAFVRSCTRLRPPPLLPEIALHLADEPYALWERTEAAAGRSPLPVPFWAFPWAGGTALARFLLDHPDRAAGQIVLDLASGSGLVAIAAARAGAAAVTANEIDPLALAAITLNAGANGVTLGLAPGDLLDGGCGPATLVLAGDACYERSLAARLAGFLARARAAGAGVLLGDPGRAYLPRHGLEPVASYQVPAWPGLEDAGVKTATVWQPARPC